MRFAGLDVGTTRMKCGVYGEDGKLVYSAGTDYGVQRWGEESYLDLGAMFGCARSLLGRAYAAAPFDGIAISSLGESFALLDERDGIVCPPMLYTDTRGEAEAEACAPFAEKLFSVSGVSPQGMYSVYKLLWLLGHRKEECARAKKLMLVADYLGYMLTGERGADYASASRTGVFDIRNKVFSEELCALLGVDVSLFSPALPSGGIVGKVKKEIASEWGAKEIVLVAGGHDQVCAAIGAGALGAGECVDGMGTVECLTAVYDEPSDDPRMGDGGYPNVPFAGGKFCTYLFTFACGSLVRWWIDAVCPEKQRDGSAFSYLEQGFPQEPTGLLVLPYFAGAATPFRDLGARGAILNLRLSDTPSVVYKGILEGLSMEMRLNLETTRAFGIEPKRLFASGGGAASEKWLQIKADVTGLPVYPPASKETGVCGAAMLSASALLGEELSSVASRFAGTGEPVFPDPARKARYDELYADYRTLYRTLRPMMKN